MQLGHTQHTGTFTVRIAFSWNFHQILNVSFHGLKEDKPRQGGLGIFRWKADPSLNWEGHSLRAASLGARRAGCVGVQLWKVLSRPQRRSAPEKASTVLLRSILESSHRAQPGHRKWRLLPVCRRVAGQSGRAA